MKNAVKLAVGVFVLLSLINLTACEKLAGMATYSEHPVSAESAGAPSSPAPGVSSSTPESENLSADEQAILGAVNEVLAGYADGTLPNPPDKRFWQNGSNLLGGVPEGVTLPQEVRYSQLSVEYKGTDYLFDYVATLPLEWNFAMEFLVVTSSEPAHVFDAAFVDELQGYYAPVLTAVFKNIRGTRLVYNVDFENFEADINGQTLSLSGTFEWHVSDAYLRVSMLINGEEYFGEFIHADGTWVLGYPGNLDEPVDPIYENPAPFDSTANLEQAVIELHAAFVDAFRV